MNEQHEGEEFDALGQQARTLERSPLSVLVEQGRQGRLSEESLAPLRRALREAPRLQAVEAEGAATLPPPPETHETGVRDRCQTTRRSRAPGRVL